MTEDRAKALMRELAASGSPQVFSDFDQLWTRSQLEEEFERRRRLVAPFVWLNAAYHSVAGLAFVAGFTWVVQLWTGQ